MEYTKLSNDVRLPLLGLGTFMISPEDTEKSVRGTVDFIVRHPLIPSDVTVYGFIIDSTTGELTRIV